MSPRIVSAEEARKLLDGIAAAPWRVAPHDDPGAGQVQDADGYYVNAEGDSDAQIMAAAPDLAATVVALSEELDALASRDALRLAEIAMLGANLDAVRAERDRLLRDFTGMDAAGWEQEEKEHAAWMAAENRGGGVVMCPDCGHGSLVDGTAEIDLSPRRCFMCELAATKKERDAYRDFAHRIAALMAPPDAVDMAVKYLEFHGLDDLAETVENRVNERPGTACICVECAAEVVHCDEERCCLNCGTDLIVVADKHSGELLIEFAQERDRLRDILACERGERAPEGWIRDSKFDRNWSNPRSNMRVDEIEPGRWQAYRWSGQQELPVGDVTPTALEAIEAADRAASEVSR